MFNINFADDWIRTADLWYWKQPLYQLSHNHYWHFKIEFFQPREWGRSSKVCWHPRRRQLQPDAVLHHGRRRPLPTNVHQWRGQAERNRWDQILTDPSFTEMPPVDRSQIYCCLVQKLCYLCFLHLISFGLHKLLNHHLCWPKYDIENNQEMYHFLVRFY